MSSGLDSAPSEALGWSTGRYLICRFGFDLRGGAVFRGPAASRVAGWLTLPSHSVIRSFFHTTFCHYSKVARASAVSAAFAATSFAAEVCKVSANGRDIPPPPSSRSSAPYLFAIFCLIYSSFLGEIVEGDGDLLCAVISIPDGSAFPVAFSGQPFHRSSKMTLWSFVHAIQLVCC